MSREDEQVDLTLATSIMTAVGAALGTIATLAGGWSGGALFTAACVARAVWDGVHAARD